MNDQDRKARLLRAAVGKDGPVKPALADWSAWAELATNERVIPLLYEVASNDATDLTGAQRASAVEMQLDVAATMVRLEHGLLDVVTRLDERAIRFAVLKGAATAHLDYHDPSRRQFGDIDLLVDPGYLDRAISALSAAGWKQAYALPRHHERFTHAVTLRSESLLEIDLHQRVAHRSLGALIPTKQLLDARAPYEVAGHKLWALSGPDRLIHAAVHSVSSRGPYRRLSSAADVLLLAAAREHEADLTLSRAESWRVRSLLEAAVTQSHDLAQLPVPDGWRRAMGTRPYRRDRLVDHAYLSPHRRPVAEELAHLRHLPNWRDRALYLSGFLSYDEEYARQTQRRGIVAQSRYLMSRLTQRSP